MLPVVQFDFLFIRFPNLSFHSYTWDKQIYLLMRPKSRAAFLNHLSEVKCWTSQQFLKQSTTNVIVQSHKLRTSLGHLKAARNMSVHFNSGLMFESHVKKSSPS